MSVFLERYDEEEVEVPLGYRNLLATIIGVQADPTTVEVIFGKYDWIKGGPQIIEIFKACPRHVDLMQQQSKRESYGRFACSKVMEDFVLCILSPSFSSTFM